VARHITLAFVKNLYVFAVLLLSDPFDLAERWFGVSYTLPSWLFWILLGIAIGLSVWRTIEDTKRSVHNQESLDAIKNDLVAIDRYEQNLAVIQSGKKCTAPTMARITDDFNALYSVSALKSILQQAYNKNIEPLFSLLKSVGEILDANGYGLKDGLQNIPAYNDTLDDLTNRLVTLHLGEKKTEIITANATRIRKGAYGLNSSMVLRAMLKRIQPRNKNEAATAHSVVVGLEALEGMVRDFLTDGLKQLDRKWKLRFTPEEPMTSQTKVILSRVSKLNKKQFGRLRDFSDMVKRNLP
jgi:hypothetical protein